MVERIACFLTCGYTESGTMQAFLRKINSSYEYKQFLPNKIRKKKGTEKIIADNINGLTGEKLIAKVYDILKNHSNEIKECKAIIIEDDLDGRFNGWSGEKVKKYMCYSISRATPAMIRSENCSNRKKHLTLAELDALVLEEIKKLALDPAALDPLIEESAEEAAPDLPVFQERMANVEKQLTRLLNLYQSGVMELEEIQGRLAALKEEREAVQKRLDEAEKANTGKLSKEAAIASLASLGAVIESGDNAALYDLVHTLIEKVVYLNGDITIYWAFC